MLRNRIDTQDRLKPAVSTRRRYRGPQSAGQSVIEFAFILPLLLLLIVGIVEMGRMMMRANMLTQAAREGARALAVGADSTSVVNRVMGILTAAELDDENPSVTWTGPDADNMMYVTVTSDYTIIGLTGILGYAGPFTLQGVSAMRLENP